MKWHVKDICIIISNSGDGIEKTIYNAKQQGIRYDNTKLAIELKVAMHQDIKSYNKIQSKKQCESKYPWCV